MDTAQTEDRSLWWRETKAVEVGVVGGVLAGLAMGTLLQIGTDIIPFLGAFAGEASLLRGWLVHLIVSVIYGVLFAVVVAYPPVVSFLDTFGTTEYVLVGVTYATMIAAVSITILPFVFEVPWTASGAEGTAGIGLGSSTIFAVAHLLYGALLGAVYAAIGDRADEAADGE